MADVLFIIGGVVLCVLLCANVVVIVAKATHKDRLAKRILVFSSHIIWIFKLGDENSMRRETGADGHIRA